MLVSSPPYVSIPKHVADGRSRSPARYLFRHRSSTVMRSNPTVRIYLMTAVVVLSPAMPVYDTPRGDPFVPNIERKRSRHVSTSECIATGVRASHGTKDHGWLGIARRFGLRAAGCGAWMDVRNRWLEDRARELLSCVRRRAGDLENFQSGVGFTVQGFVFGISLSAVLLIW